jgi:nondiscriminating aspartyl-tRNA synthetase
VFRAEPHDTPRHLNEYVSLDFEIGFVDDHTTVMAILTGVLSSMVEAVREEAPETVALLKLALPRVPREIPAIHFLEAQRLITEGTGEDLEGESDLAPAHERWLGDWALRTHASEFLFVVGYPMAKRPFYTHPQPDR